MKTPGQRAYEAYCGVRAWRSFNGDPLPGWDDAQEDIQDGWEIAAAAARQDESDVDVDRAEREVLENTAMAIQLADMLITPIASRRKREKYGDYPDGNLVGDVAVRDEDPIVGAWHFIGFASLLLCKALNDGEEGTVTAYLSGLLTGLAGGDPNAEVGLGITESEVSDE